MIKYVDWVDWVLEVSISAPTEHDNEHLGSVTVVAFLD
jgi:hypothetical protein